MSRHSKAVLRTTLFLGMTVLALSALLDPSRAAGLSPGSLNGTVSVPLDHDHPEFGSFDLYFEFGAAFDPSLPTVIYCQDGQQFRIKEGRVAKVQERFFTPEINLLGVPGRIYTDAVAAAVRDDNGTVDWQKAYQYYCSRQWCGDLDAVRRAVLGENGGVVLYGRSGGAMLVQEYLARYGDHTIRAFVQAAGNPKLEVELERPTDPFWEEIGRSGDALQTMLTKALAQHPERRAAIVEALSRQHFFHKADDLARERAAFIEALHSWNEDAVEQKLEEYEVNAIRRMMDSSLGIAIRVRQYEFFQPVRHLYELDGRVVSPTPEMQYHTARPLLELHDAGKLPAWDIDLAALGRFSGEVFILAGADDVAIPPAYQKRLAGLFERSTLFLARDDHMMKNLQEADLYIPLHTSFLVHGLQSKELEQVLSAAASLRVEE